MTSRKGFVFVGAFVVAEIVVIVAFATKQRPTLPPPQAPTIAAPVATVTSAETVLRLSAQAADRTVVAFQIDWGDGHRSQLNIGCRQSSSTPKYGGETIAATARHADHTSDLPQTPVRARAVARSCIAGISGQQFSPWHAAFTAPFGGDGAR